MCYCSPFVLRHLVVCIASYVTCVRTYVRWLLLGDRYERQLRATLQRHKRSLAAQQFNCRSKQYVNDESLRQNLALVSSPCLGPSRVYASASVCECRLVIQLFRLSLSPTLRNIRWIAAAQELGVLPQVRSVGEHANTAQVRIDTRTRMVGGPQGVLAQTYLLTAPSGGDVKSGVLLSKAPVSPCPPPGHLRRLPLNQQSINPTLQTQLP